MDDKMEEVLILNDLTVIQVKATKTSKTTCCLYIKEYSRPETASEDHPSKPAGRTLFVSNVPPYATEAGLKQMFSECGLVKDVSLQPKPSFVPPPVVDDRDYFARRPPSAKGYQVAYVVFKSKSAVQRAIKLPYAGDRCLSSADCPLVFGLEKYRNEYIAASPPPPAELQAQIASFIKKHDERVEQEKQTAKESEGVPDDEGFITVTRSKGVPNTVVNDKRRERKLRKRKRDQELFNFYKFQVREKKKDHIKELQKKFEEDKQRIAQMRALRKFRPY